MDDKQINKWLRRRFSPIGWLLLAYYGIFALMAVLAILCENAAWFLSGAVGPGSLGESGWGYITAIAVGLTIVYAWKGSDFFTVELRRRERAMTTGTFAALITLFVGAQVLNGLWVSGLEWVANQFGGTVMDVLDSVSGSSDTPSMFLYVCILAPIWEEILFRGLVQGALRPFGKRFAIFGSALLFGAFHGNLLQTPYAFLVGLVLGYAAEEYSLRWSVAIHVFNNLVLAELLTRLQLALPGNAQVGIDLLFCLVGLAALPVLICNRRKIQAYNAKGMDRRVLKCFFTSPGITAMLILAVASMAASI